MSWIWKSAAEKAAKQKKEEDAIMHPRRQMIGKTVVVQRTDGFVVVKEHTFLYNRVTESTTISGKVTDVGLKTICIDGVWFEENHQEPNGVRIVEFIEKSA